MKFALLSVAALVAAATTTSAAAATAAKAGPKSEFLLADVLQKKLAHKHHANNTQPVQPLGVNWIHRPANSRPQPAKPVDWANLKTIDNTVPNIDWSEAYTPSNAGMQPGSTADAGEHGKAYGTSGVSYSDSRFGTGYWQAADSVGSLTFDIAGSTYVCTATLIGKSLLVTAAHCVYSFGTNSQSGWYTNFRFYPQKSGSSNPHGYWEWNSAMILSTYYAGTDTCKNTAPGIVCNNDIALIWLEPTGSKYSRQAGVQLGFFGYGWNGYSFSTPSSTVPSGTSAASIFGTKPYVAVTQLGYPVAFDQGTTMQLDNSAGFKFGSTGTTNGQALRNLVIGSSLTGGSSGGPYVANFGVNAALSGTTRGSASGRNIIVAVNSWGYTDTSIKLDGASWFGQNYEYPNAAYGNRGAGNIGKLMYDACDNTAVSGWQLQSKGYCR